MNTTQIIGRITREVKVMTSQKGTNYIKNTLAYKNDFLADTSSFVDIMVMGKQCERFVHYVDKGDLIYASGKFEQSKYINREGKESYAWTFYITEFLCLESPDKKREKIKSKKEQQDDVINTVAEELSKQEQPTIDPNDDLPF